MKYKKVTKKIKERIFFLKQQGLGTAAIAKMVNRSPHTVGYYFNREKKIEYFRKKRESRTPEQKAYDVEKQSQWVKENRGRIRLINKRSKRKLRALKKAALQEANKIKLIEIAKRLKLYEEPTTDR